MITPGPALAVVLVVLVTAAALVLRLGRIGRWPAVVTASARAVVQLGVVSLLITAVLGSVPLTALFIAVMFGVAAATSARRVGGLRVGGWTAVALGAGVVPVLGLLVGSGLVPLRPVALVPIAGILIGGAMTATSLAGRRALEVLRTRHGEYEAARALGFGRRDAVLLICRPSAGDALVPAVDQTRTVGLVTLPGAFVGVLLGGATPVQAGATQVLVLVALLVVEAVAALVVVELVAAGRLSA
ncbi:ABC transporter permease [Umezawaea sp. NPDC059074]|uniref:ABC transporter permease n=1 Tax=Umezawaea sp. NPDC059074 TaxID=3346716 RepID=UPI00368731C1